MKKILIVIMIITMGILFVGCSNEEGRVADHDIIYENVVTWDNVTVTGWD